MPAENPPRTLCSRLWRVFRMPDRSRSSFIVRQRGGRAFALLVAGIIVPPAGLVMGILEPKRNLP